MNDIVKKEEAEVVEMPKNEDQTTAMISMIERAAMNPDVDIDKMERLLQMQERIVDKKAESSFARAMNQAQAEMAPISADAVNPQTRSKYATYAALDRALRPIYTKHGLSLSFDEGDTDKDGYVRVLCYVSHQDGYSRTYHKDMPVVNTGMAGKVNMTMTHANASADSYGMRYLLKKIFNVAIGENDDDGNSAGNVQFITDEQQATIQDLLDSTGSDKQKFLKWLQAKSLSEIRKSQYKSAVDALKKKVKK